MGIACIDFGHRAVRAKAATVAPRARPGLSVMAALSLLVAAAAPGHAQEAPSRQPPIPQVVATGIGETQAAPDIAVLRFAVESTASDAARAGQDNAVRMASLREALEKAGIAAPDIATTGYSVRSEPRGNESPGKERTPAFVARNGIRVTLRALERVGSTIDAALAGGANRVDDVAFRLFDERALRHKALALAVAQARAQAQTMATAAGGRLGALIELSSAGPGGDGGQPFIARAALAATPISAGDLTLREQVVARWRFLPDTP